VGSQCLADLERSLRQYQITYICVYWFYCTVLRIVYEVHIPISTVLASSTGSACQCFYDLFGV